MVLHCVIFPVPYGYTYTDFDVLCVQQMILNTDYGNIFNTRFSMSSSSLIMGSVINHCTAHAHTHTHTHKSFCKDALEKLVFSSKAECC
jgi:hypothetical protein